MGRHAGAGAVDAITAARPSAGAWSPDNPVTDPRLFDAPLPAMSAAAQSAAPSPAAARPTSQQGSVVAVGASPAPASAARSFIAADRTAPPRAVAPTAAPPQHAASPRVADHQRRAAPQPLAPQIAPRPRLAAPYDRNRFTDGPIGISPRLVAASLTTAPVPVRLPVAPFSTPPEQLPHSLGRRSVSLAVCAVAVLGAVSAAAMLMPTQRAAQAEEYGNDALATRMPVPAGVPSVEAMRHQRHRHGSHHRGHHRTGHTPAPGLTESTPAAVRAAQSALPAPTTKTSASASASPTPAPSSTSASPVSGLPIGSGDFVLGSTKPNASNTGVGVVRAAPTRVINGDVTLTGNESLVDTIVRGRVIVKGTDNVIENNLITGPVDRGYTTSTWLVDTSQATRAIVRFNTIRAAHTSDWVNGIGLRNVTAQRNDISRVIDGFDVTPAPGSSSLNTSIEGNYIHDLMFFAPDAGHAPTPTGASYHGPWANTPWSHDDGIQVIGGSGLRIVGNTFAANWADDIGTLPLPTIVKELSALMINAPRQAVTGLTMDQNWVDGGEFAINGTGGVGDGSFNGNRFGRHSAGRGDSTYTMVFGPGFHAATSDNTYEDSGVGIFVRNNY